MSKSQGLSLILSDYDGPLGMLSIDSKAHLFSKKLSYVIIMVINGKERAFYV